MSISWVTGDFNRYATIYWYGDHSITAKDGEPLNRGFKILIYLEKNTYDHQKRARTVKDSYRLPTTKYHCPSTTNHHHLTKILIKNAINSGLEIDNA